MAEATTQKTFRVSLTIDGDDWGVWDTKAGGKLNGNVLTYLPGGMEPQVSLPGGRPTIDLITLARYYDRTRDHARIGDLIAAAGTGACVVKQRPLDKNGAGHGRSITWTGILQSVDPPATDGNSDNAALITIEIAAQGPITVA